MKVRSRELIEADFVSKSAKFDQSQSTEDKAGSLTSEHDGKNEFAQL